MPQPAFPHAGAIRLEENIMEKSRIEQVLTAHKEQGLDCCEAVFTTYHDLLNVPHWQARAIGHCYGCNTGINGVLDTKPYSDEIHRSWIFRSVGYGHAHQTWKDMMSALRMVGYDGPISIEHEDSLMTPSEGLNKAIAMLKDVMMFEAKGPMWWA